MRPEEIGKLGEKLVCEALGFRRQPASGAFWPRKEDVLREGQVAQVKTTTSKKFMKKWLDLYEYAKAEGREPRWFEVVLMPDWAYVFEKTLVTIQPRGVEATGTVRRGRNRIGAKIAKAGSHLRRGVQTDDSRKGRRRDGLA